MKPLLHYYLILTVDVKVGYQDILNNYNQIMDEDLPAFISLMEKENVEGIIITSPIRKE